MMAPNELLMDIEAVCRVCLQDSDTQMVSIYERDEEQRGLSICEKIENCSGIKVILPFDTSVKAKISEIPF